MKYENLNKFIISTKAPSTDSTKRMKTYLLKPLRSGKRMFPTDHARYFDSEIMFDENKILRQENQPQWLGNDKIKSSMIAVLQTEPAKRIKKKPLHLE